MEPIVVPNSIAFAHAIQRRAYELVRSTTPHFDIFAEVASAPKLQSDTQPYVYTFSFLDRSEGFIREMSYMGRNEVDASEFNESTLARDHLGNFGSTLEHLSPPLSFALDKHRPRLRVYVPAHAEQTVSPARARSLFATMRAALE